MEGAAIPPRWCLRGGRGHGAPASGGKGRLGPRGLAQQSSSSNSQLQGKATRIQRPAQVGVQHSKAQGSTGNQRPGLISPSFGLQKEFAAREQALLLLEHEGETLLVSVKAITETGYHESSCSRSNYQHPTRIRVPVPPPSVLRSSMDATSSPSPPPSATWVFAPGPGPPAPAGPRLSPGQARLPDPGSIPLGGPPAGFTPGRP